MLYEMDGLNGSTAAYVSGNSMVSEYWVFMGSSSI